MGLFNNLMSKIFGYSSGASASAVSGTQSSAPASTASGGGAVTATQTVDVAAILDALAAKNPEKLDWKHSIVDLMKLVGMDSNFTARKQLAIELHYTGDPNDSASMNLAAQGSVEEAGREWWEGSAGIAQVSASDKALLARAAASC